MNKHFPAGPKLFNILKRAKEKNHLKLVEDLISDYGATVGLNLPFKKICLTSDPEMIEIMFIKHFSKLRKWKMAQFDLVLGQGLLTSQGELWTQQRRAIQPIFKPELLKKYSLDIIAECESMLKNWKKNEVRNIYQDMLDLSLNIIVRTLFCAEDVHKIYPPLHRAQHLLMSSFEDSMTLPIPLSLPTPRNIKIKNAVDELKKTISEMMKKNKGGFLQLLLENCSDEKQVIDECMTMILAGHETTATALTWTLYLLALHKMEVNEENVENIILESMRLYTPVWAIGRVATEDLEFKEYLIPKNTSIIFLPFLTHKMEKYFPQPLEFKPERWKDQNNLPNGVYLPFGMGPRKCVGMNFAMMEIKFCLLNILKNYRMHVPKDFKLELQPSVTLRPRNGLKLQIDKITL